jgi:thiamine biosynthesis lipoprotein
MAGSPNKGNLDAIALSSKSEERLGSVISIQLPSEHAPLFPLCFSELGRIESAYSRFLPSSGLSLLNESIGKWQSASPEMIHLLVAAENFRERTLGNFDISVKEDLERLGYGPKGKMGAKGASISSANAPNAIIDGKNGKVLLNRGIDFGGFGKGYALDCVAALLASKGVSHYCINAGGDIMAKSKKGKAPWHILLEHPDDPSRAIGTIKLDGMAIAGTAPNRRKWGEFHHLINAKTRMPSKGAKAIFVLARTGIEADAYATAIFTAGFEEGIAISKELPVEMLFVSSQGKMYVSPGFKAEIFSD